MKLNNSFTKGIFISFSFSFLNLTNANYFHLRDVHQVSRYGSQIINKNYNKLRDKIDKILKKSKNNIIIIGGATSLYFHNKRVEGRSLHWDKMFVDKKSKKYEIFFPNYSYDFHCSQLVRVRMPTKLDV